MGELLDILLAKTPKCIANFTSSQVSIPLPSSGNTGPQFVTKTIKCQCGNDDLYLEAAQHKQIKGVCKKLELISFAPPIYVSCKNCKSFKLLFNPLMHGWKGETNKEDNSDSDYSLISCNSEPGTVYVNYSYRHIHNYETLLKNGIDNPEDYFDTFTVFQRISAAETVKEIVSMELVNELFTKGGA